MTLVVAGAAPWATAGSPPVELGRLAGQTIMTGFSGRHPDAALLARIRAGRVGGVILFGGNIDSPAELRAQIGQLQRQAAAGGNPPLLIAVDQEGGPVRRLPDGPPELSAAAMGRSGSVAKARSEGEATGRFLHGFGINVDLAPVLDSPDSGSSWLGSRAFSGDPRLNARLGPAFAVGLQQAGVAATAKHFPGLGTARANTDLAHVWITTPKAGLDARLQPFKEAVARGVKLVMVSNAGYAAYDPSGRPAVLSPRIASGLLREQLGFDGVTISDALEAPGPSSRPATAAKAIAAGIDVLLYTSETNGAAAFDQLVSAARSGSLARADLERAAGRIAALKRWIGRN